MPNKQNMHPRPQPGRRAADPRRLRGRVADAARRLAGDTRGGEMMEYALVAGLCAIAAIGIVTVVGQKLVPMWQNLSDQWTTHTDNASAGLGGGTSGNGSSATAGP